MKNKSLILLIVGVVALVIGGYLYFQIDGDAVNQKNIEILSNATNAEDAARLISANNRSEVDGNSIALFLLGLGGAMTLLSLVGLLKKNPEVEKR